MKLQNSLTSLPFPAGGGVKSVTEQELEALLELLGGDDWG
jgi:hypothetical protein